MLSFGVFKRISRARCGWLDVYFFMHPFSCVWSVSAGLLGQGDAGEVRPILRPLLRVLLRFPVDVLIA